MRKLLFTVLALMAAATVAALADVPENLVLDGCGDEKAPVEFPHQAHFEITDCVTCHHTSEGLTLETVADMEVETCVSCHLEPEDADTPNCTEKSLRKNAYHISCVGCHKDHHKEVEESKAPKKCSECHPKD